MRGLAIAGRSASGKDWLIGILRATFAGVELVSASAFVRNYAIQHKLTEDGQVIKGRDTELLQRLGHELTLQIAEYTLKECRLLRQLGKIPILGSVRKPLDQKVANTLGYPIVLVTAPMEMRLERLIKRDNISRANALAILGDKQTEDTVDNLCVDHIFKNDGRHTEEELGKFFTFLASVR